MHRHVAHLRRRDAGTRQGRIHRAEETLGQVAMAQHDVGEGSADIQGQRMADRPRFGHRVSSDLSRIAGRCLS
jgi:hypothetical protein